MLARARGRDVSTTPRLEPPFPHAESNASNSSRRDETADRRRLVSEAVNYTPQCDVIEDGVLFPDTLETHATGRTRFSRKKALLKFKAAMHKYGGRCMLTLVVLCFQSTHVISVSSDDSRFIRFLEWVLSDKFGNFFNIHSTRNLWLVDADIHYALDRGLDRKKAFPAEAIPYWITGILWSPECVIHRDHLIAPHPPNAMNTGKEVIRDDGGFIYEDIGKVRAPSAEVIGRGPPSNETDDLKILHASPVLKVRPPQDPLLRVTANVGNFLRVLKNKVDWDREQAANRGNFIYQDWHVDRKASFVRALRPPTEETNRTEAGPSTVLQPPAPLRRFNRHTHSNTEDFTSDAGGNVAGPSGSYSAPRPTLLRRGSRITQSEAEAEAAAAATMPPPADPASRPPGAKKKRQVSRNQAAKFRKSHRRGKGDNASTSSRSERD
uniref:Uncharacterized protein n=1 Tax=Moniliophthora roreri TaxID=221103 RepID=A0A0W0G4S8_MONRR